MPIRPIVCLVAVLVAMLALPAAAQSWPSRPVKLVVPFPAGGTVDTAARIVGVRFADMLGQPFVVENKPGAGGLIGVESVVKAPADGYTLLVGSNGPVLYSPVIFNRPAYEWRRDLAPIGSISFIPMVLQVHPSVPAQSLGELLAIARADPSWLTLCTPGAGTSNHLASELLQSLSGARWITVHYKGNAPALNDLLAGQVHFDFDQVLVTLPHIKDGKLRPLAVTSSERIASLPDVPTMAESGFKDFQAITFVGMLAPTGTPDAVIAMLSERLSGIVREPPVVETFAAMGADARAMTAAQFSAHLAREEATWIPVIRAAKITAE
jgi:tripartite-type tricarboxylate transporter receptor subunit TctC